MKKAWQWIKELWYGEDTVRRQQHEQYLESLHSEHERALVYGDNANK